MKTLTITLATLLGLSTAAPTVQKRWPPNSAAFRPTAISTYDGSNGGITYNVATGTVSFAQQKSALVEFDAPAYPAGSKCSLHFYLDGMDTQQSITGSGGLDIFSSLSPAPHYNVAAWGPPGNQRNQHLGRLVAHTGADSTVDPNVSGTVASFDCPPAGPVGYEVVGIWDTAVQWDAGFSGLYLVKN